ncbi:MAG: VOC family protein [Clostridia bacterium]|nr:VOC family protein [Clostridia bacterium]
MANEIIKGARFHHAALRANDFERTLAFYQALGFKIFKRWGEGESSAAMLDIGSGEYFEVFAGGRDETPYGRYFHLAVGVDSCDEAFAAAIRAGAKEKSAPRDADIPSKPEIYPVRIAFVYGPDGEEIEFFQVRG